MFDSEPLLPVASEQCTLGASNRWRATNDGSVRDVTAYGVPVYVTAAGRRAGLDLTYEYYESGRLARIRGTAAALVARCRSMLEGLGALGIDGSARDAASTLASSSEVFAGSVRLAPSDPLPWPFSAPAVEAPSIFTPLDLSPVEWRDRSGALVFGWRIGE